MPTGVSLQERPRQRVELARPSKNPPRSRVIQMRRRTKIHAHRGAALRRSGVHDPRGQRERQRSSNNAIGRAIHQGSSLKARVYLSPKR